MKHGYKLAFVSLFLITVGINAFSKDPIITVNVQKPIAPVQPTMWGIFFEDINLAADGGIYSELVKNRSFEFTKPFMGWNITKEDNVTDVLIINQGEVNPVNPRFARIQINGREKPVVLSNEGFRGIGIKEGVTYHFSVLARDRKNSKLNMHIELVNSKGKVIGSANLNPESNEWKKYNVSFQANETEKNAKLNITIDGNGELDLDMISLFPGNTWKNRPGGLRADLVQLLYDLKPGFLRFPGGCIVEGHELATRYQWKKTVGDVDQRQLIVNRWNTEFKHRPTPDYFQTFGLGFFEYFQLAEDIGAEPLPILSCGMACQFNTGELVPTDQLDPYIQDALDLIEFANGATTSTWGKVRAEMGHPAPFNLKMIGIGNEQWGPQYIERYVLFAKAISEKYPTIKIVSGTGPSPDGKFFDYAAQELKKLNAQIVDEHYYASPEWFLQNATRYDNYDRKGYKIFAGEYAAQSINTCNPDNKNNWKCAIAEAAFMTGLERNAEVVNLCSYAPLLAHVDGWQWTPDLIWFDNLNSFGTANYYVQKMFSNNKGTQVLPMLEDGKPLVGQNGLYASATFDQNSKEIILKLVNSTDKEQKVTIALEGAKKLATKGTMTVMKSDDLTVFNSIEQPMKIVPIEQELTIKGKTVSNLLSASSFTVIKIKQIQ